MKKRNLILSICLVTLTLVLGISLVSAGAWAKPASSAQRDETDPAPASPAGNERSSAPSASALNANERAAAAPSAEEVEAALTVSLNGPAFLVLPPAAFTTDGYDPDGFFNYFSGGYFYGIVPSGACVLAPVQLPAGVTITGLEVRLNDNNATASEWFDLYRTNLATGATQLLASVSSPTGTTGGVVALVDNTVSNPTVSDMYAYQLCTCTRETVYVYGARIGYSHSIALPLVPRNWSP